MKTLPVFLYFVNLFDLKKICFTRNLKRFKAALNFFKSADSSGFSQWSLVGLSHRRRIKTEEKAKVIASVGGKNLVNSWPH